MVLLYKYYFILTILKRLKRHITRGTPLNSDVRARHILRSAAFWMDFCVYVIHLPPFITFEVEVQTMANVIVWRGEMMGCLWNSLR